MKETLTLEMIARMFRVGFYVLISGLLFAMTETLYFGTNLYPKSQAEFTCDYIASIISGAGMGIMVYALVNHFILKIREIPSLKQEEKNKVTIIKESKEDISGDFIV